MKKLLVMCAALVGLNIVGMEQSALYAAHVLHGLGRAKHVVMVSCEVATQAKQRVIYELDELEQGFKISMVVGIAVGITVSMLGRMVMQYIH